MPHNHGINVMVGDDDSNMRKVWTARHSPQRRAKQMTAADIRQMAVTAHRVITEVERRTAPYIRTFDELSRQLAASPAVRGFATFLKQYADLQAGKGTRSW